MDSGVAATRPDLRHVRLPDLVRLGGATYILQAFTRGGGPPMATKQSGEDIGTVPLSGYFV